MSYPPGITLRPVTIGGATALESGEQLSLVAEIKSSRGLMWGATGWQFHAVPLTITGNEGEELSFSLPVTDLAGWRLLDNPGSAIDVSAPGSYTHTYTVKLTTRQGGRAFAVRTVGPFVLPSEDLSPVDLDLMLPVGTQAGGVVLVPDTWDARVAAAEAAAIAVASTLTSEDAAVAMLVDNPESATREALSRTTVQLDTDRARAGRENAARWTQAEDGLASLTSAGLTETGAHIGATVAGTAGDAIMPIWRPNGDFRASFRVKASKATPGSVAGIGFTAGTPMASLPASTDVAWVIGYVQGSGIAVRPYNVSGGVVSIIVVPDSVITDGQEWDVSIWADPFLNRRASVNNAFYLRATTAGGGAEYRSTLNVNGYYGPTNVLLRANVADAISQAEVCTHPTGRIGQHTVGAGKYYEGDTAHDMALRIPAAPSGKLVFALHGHGSSGEAISRDPSMMPTWTALNGAGFTVAYPDLGSSTHWANDTAMEYLAEAHRLMVSEYGMDPEVYMYGISMGGAAVLTAIAKRVIPIRAAYVAHPTCDMRTRWADPATWPTLQAAYGGAEAEMLDNNPISQPAASYAGVPLLFTASPDDSVVPKAAHTDAMRAHLGSVTPTYLITVTGDHMDASHFRAQDALNFLRANI